MRDHPICHWFDPRFIPDLLRFIRVLCDADIAALLDATKIFSCSPWDIAIISCSKNGVVYVGGSRIFEKSRIYRSAWVITFLQSVEKKGLTG